MTATMTDRDSNSTATLTMWSILCINIVALLSSIFVATWIVVVVNIYSSDPLERDEVASSYLIWNCLTTIVWLGETIRNLVVYYRPPSLSAASANGNEDNDETSPLLHEEQGNDDDDDDDGQQTTATERRMDMILNNLTKFFLKHSSTLIIIELSLAVYFTMDSIKLITNWRLDREDVEADLVEVSLNVVAYGYISFLTVLELNQIWKSNNTTNGEQHQAQRLSVHSGQL
mmetsp:Transcript_12914/g.31406  ORF Transcript_12914/g.31406 Transcript_12914/m.31406 type:complete len:230 (+) Transcript_12914:73-762(+)